MKNICAIAASMVLGVPLATSASLAADSKNGQKLARKCTVCHGKLGLGKDPEVPHLAGQPALYLQKSLVDYQTGKREDRRMTLIAKPLSQQDIMDIAAWFSSIEIEAKSPDS